jgi:hypothetical protein
MDEFDPYFQWLGIPPEEQPPTLYRLLGVRDFEPDRTVIAQAAAQRMQSLRQYQDGPRYQRATQLRTELSKAKVELLEPQRRAAYDLFLQQRNAPRPPSSVAARQPATVAAPAMPTPTAQVPVMPAPVLPVPVMTAPVVHIPSDTPIPSETPVMAMEPAPSPARVTPAAQPAQPASAPRRKPRSRINLIAIAGIISGGPVGIAIGIYLAQSMGLDVFGTRPAVTQPDLPPEKKTIVIVRPRPEQRRPTPSPNQ